MKDTLDIGIVTPTSLQNQGGMETSTSLLVNELRRIGHHVIHLSPNKSASSWNVFGGVGFVSNDISVDVFHVQQTDMSVRYASLLKRKFPSIPVITTVHGLISTNKDYCKLRLSPTEPARQLLRIIPGKHFERESITASDCVVTPSMQIYRDCLWWNPNCKVIPNGIDMQMFSQMQRIGNDSPRILCPGRIFEERGQIYLIEALPIILKSIDCTVTFVGGKSDAYFNKVLSRAIELGVENHISFMNPVAYTDTPELYRAYDLIVIPTLAESFGMTIVENLALGNVVVASNVENIPNIITDGENGLLVNPKQPMELTSAIIRGITDISLRNTIYTNARKSVLEYDISDVAERMEEVYRSVM